MAEDKSKQPQRHSAPRSQSFKTGQKVEVAVPKEMGLKEALQKGAVNFKGKKLEAVKKEFNKKEFLPKVSKGNKKSDNRQQPSNVVSGSQSKKLQPGRTVRINKDES